MVFVLLADGDGDGLVSRAPEMSRRTQPPKAWSLLIGMALRWSFWAALNEVDRWDSLVLGSGTLVDVGEAASYLPALCVYILSVRCMPLPRLPELTSRHLPTICQIVFSDLDPSSIRLPSPFISAALNLNGPSNRSPRNRPQKKVYFPGAQCSAAAAPSTRLTTYHWTKAACIPPRLDRLTPLVPPPPTAAPANQRA